MSNNLKKVAIYGGNGFVGTHCAEQLHKLGADVVCLSRTGHKPIHLKDQAWSHEVRWCKGDAADPCQTLLSTIDTIVCAVGSPPLPTFSAAAYQHQLHMNGSSCIKAMAAAKDAGVMRVVLLGARIPLPMKTERFAYYKGKQSALDAARRFAQESDQHSSVVLQPGMITGKRALSNGNFIRLDWLTAPFSPFMPWQFVSVERVAMRVADAALNIKPYAGQFTIIRNRDI